MQALWIAAAVLVGIGLWFFVSAIAKAKRQRKPEPEPLVLYRVFPMGQRTYLHEKFECREECLVYALGKDDANPIGILNDQFTQVHVFGQCSGVMMLDQWDRNPATRAHEFWTLDGQLAEQVADDAVRAPLSRSIELAKVDAKRRCQDV